MSAMSRIATTLELDWHEQEDGYYHRSGKWALVRPQVGEDLDLFFNPTRAENGWIFQRRTDLISAVDYVERIER
ncbi:hypothetical protein SEA_SUMTER_82 [Mycobacterium phage Sumter]|nr:hypothetical protein SEA_SUMTER_82 [Mycobacterium phage Sumter]